MRTIKQLLLLLIPILLGNSSYGQGVAISSDGSSAHASAIMEVKSTSQGMLIPRMTLAQRNAITNPATGLVIFQTDGTSDLYIYNGAAWESAGWSVNNSGWTRGLGTTTTTNNVGIGTASPAEELHVVGNLRMEDGNQAAGKVLTSDASGTATWATPTGGSGTTSTYGEMYEHNARGVWSTIPITIADTYYSWKTAKSGNLNQVAFADNAAGDRLVVSQAGTYLIHAAIAFRTLNNTVIIDGAVFHNGVIQNDLKTRRFLSAGDIGSTSISGLIYLNAGDYIDLRFTSEDSGDEVRIGICNLNMVRIQ